MSEIEFEEYLDKDGEPASRVRRKFASGLTGEFGFWEYDNGDGGADREVYFTIYRKKRDFWPEDKRTTTGRDGLEPAMWALECLEAISHPPHEGYKYIRVLCGWMDKRRKEVYTRVLGKRGFHRGLHHGEEVLMRLTTRNN